MSKRFDWIPKIRKGDILAEGNTFRVVRAVHHTHVSGYGIRTSVSFTIRHCSWTTRCYTVLNSNDLKQRRFRHTGKRVRLGKLIDMKIERELGGIPKAQIKLHCCDVEGVG